MLRSLRLQLSLLYLLAALGLVAVLGAGTYGLLILFFQRSTDLALQYKMATEFRLRGFSLPPELATAEQAWMQGNTPLIQPSPTYTLGSEGSGDQNDSEGSGTEAVYSSESDTEDRYDGSLAPVFVLPDAGEKSAPGVPVVYEPAAISAALQRGSDLRTISLRDNSRVRLLTYRVGNGMILQVARLLGDQDRLLSQYLTGLLILGSAISLVLAMISWGLAGRSIKPVQRAWDQQQQFISNASHELRTPLTLIRASADYALRNPAIEEREASLRDILGDVDYMNRLVEDLLLLSRLDAHRLTLEAKEIIVPDLLAELSRQMEKVAQNKGVTLQLDPSHGTVLGDEIRLRQVLLILLDNSLRFTPGGGVIQLGSQVGGHYVTMYVADNGSGIPSEHLSHVFERFYQVPGQASEGHGNGLGLSIAKALVEAQRGTISINSSPGRGSTVAVHMPKA